MSNVDESVDKNDILDENPLVSHEDEDQHDRFEFPNDDNLDDIPFPRLLFDATVWWAQPFDNGDANPNMHVLDDFKCSHTNMYD